MRLPKILVALGVAALFTLTPAVPAQAGGWAVTYLDPLPERFDAGQSYTLGFWVLQHGSHPYEGDLGSVGITLVDSRGTASPFAGVRLPEPAHYAAAIAIARPGSYQVIAVQGLFQEYQVGTLRVPGGLTIAPTPQPRTGGDSHDYWGVIRPPLKQEGGAAFKPQSGADRPAEAAAHVPGAAAAPIADGPATSIGMIAAIAGAGIIAVILVIARRPVTELGRDAWKRIRRRPTTS